MIKKSLSKVNTALFIFLIITVLLYFAVHLFYIPHVKYLIQDLPGIITPLTSFIMSCNYYFKRTFLLSLIATPSLLFGLNKLIVKHDGKSWVAPLLGGMIILELTVVIFLITGTELSKEREMVDTSTLKIEGQ